MADELNLLIQPNSEIVDRARTQVGNLAHALKTPLSVLGNEAQGNKPDFGAKVIEQIAIMRDQVSLYLDRARRAARAQTLGAVTEVEPVLAALAAPSCASTRTGASPSQSPSAPASNSAARCRISRRWPATFSTMPANGQGRR